ncbi:MAG: hypothetical protein WC050_02875 [Candidatus Paceibacterota bacterium]
MSRAARDEGKTLLVRASSPKGLLWEGRAQSVSSLNSQGPFDLLPEHAHFISLIERQPIVIVKEGGEEETLIFQSAVIRLFDDVVNIYADIQ